MRERALRDARGLRLALELALAACTLWLLVQNLALLALLPWAGTQQALETLGPVLKAVWLAVRMVWPWAMMVAVAAAGSAALVLAGLVAARRGWEVRHG